jgi:hypothetical protein
VADDRLLPIYLDEVSRRLHLPPAQARRILDEIEGHLHDAADERRAAGTPESAAMAEAIAAFGSPDDVATAFASARKAARTVRGWRRWAPIVVPAVWFAGLAALLVISSVGWLPGGATRGQRNVLLTYLFYVVVTGALALGAATGVRRADAAPGWRTTAWACTACTVAVAAMPIFR